MNSAQRQALRAQAHRLRPVVLIGEQGLSPAVLTEIERHLSAHGLIKIHVAHADREARDDMLHTVCTQLSCAAVHHIGKTLVVYRPIEPKGGAEADRAARPTRHHIPKKKAASRSARQAVRERLKRVRSRPRSALSLRAGARSGRTRTTRS